MTRYDVSVFNNDERLWINSASENSLIADLTVESFVGYINTAIIVNGGDEQVLSLATGLLEKVECLSRSEWQSIIEQTPLDVVYDNADIGFADCPEGFL